MSRENLIPMECGVVAAAVMAALAFSSALVAADGDFSDGITVDSTVDAVDSSVGDGICSDSAGGCTLRAAVQEANATTGPQTIFLGAGTHQLTLPGGGEDAALTGDLDVTDSVTVIGVGVDSSVIDANGSVTLDRAFHLRDTSGLGLAVSLQDLTVSNGAVLNQNGGGILLEATEGGGPAPVVPEAEVVISLTLQGVAVSANLADSDMVDPGTGQPVGGSGGGVYGGAALNLTASRVVGNTAAANGGGFYAGGAVTLVGSVVSGNAAAGGGGVFETGSHISSYTDCAIQGNTAVGGGGLASRTQTTVQFLNCTIDGNSATDVGGGIQTNGTVNLVYSTVTSNQSATDSPNGGAGLNSFASGSFRLWSTLVADNKVSVASTPTVRNCGCTGGSCTAMVQFLSLGHNLEDIDSCHFVRMSDLTGTNPLLKALDSTVLLAPVRPLRSGSPAIDAGDPAVCPAADQRGTPRPLNGNGGAKAACDIGAFEFDPVIFSDGFETGDTSAWSLTVGS